MAFIHLNGSHRPKQELLSGANHPALHVGDGFFETMRWEDGQIALWEGHIRRMKKAMKLLNMALPTHVDEEFLLKAIKELTNLNGQNKARVRLQVYRLDASSENSVNSGWLIETETPVWTDLKTYSLCLYSDEAKSTDTYSNLKHGNYQLYHRASHYAAEKKYDDAVVLNSKGHVCDSSRANIFMICGERIVTPSLEEGCIAGVFREYFLSALSQAGKQVTECSIHPDELYKADEIFLTNSVRGIMPIHEWEGNKMKTDRSAELASIHSMRNISLNDR
jgi:branched-chain amino acid aminotransferase